MRAATPSTVLPTRRSRGLLARGAADSSRGSVLRQRSCPRQPAAAASCRGTRAVELWGVHTLYQSVVDGRDGQPISRVEKDGRRTTAVTGGVLTLSHEGLRSDVVPPDGPVGELSASVNVTPAIPTRMLLSRRDEFRKALERLEEAHTQLRGVRDTDGRSLVEVEGLPANISSDMRTRSTRSAPRSRCTRKPGNNKTGTTQDAHDEGDDIEPSGAPAQRLLVTTLPTRINRAVRLYAGEWLVKAPFRRFPVDLVFGACANGLRRLHRRRRTRPSGLCGIRVPGWGTKRRFEAVGRTPA